MKKTVLLIDDDSAVLSSLSLGLEDAGYVVKVASTPLQAKKLLETEQFDVVLTDIVMPDFDGLEVVRHVKKLSPNSKIIAFSGYTNSSYLKTAGFFGANEVLNKPVTPAVLCGTIEKVLRT